MHVLAAQNAPLLRRLASPEPIASLKALAAELGRDDSNLNKSLKALESEGLVTPGDRLKLTSSAHALLPRLDVLEGLADAPEDMVTLRHDQLRPSPLNPRKDFASEDAAEGLDTLRQSIVERGLQQNLLVRGEPDANGVRWIIAGERRWRAIGDAITDGDLASNFPIACKLMWVSDDEHEADALIENLLRRDLHPLEEAAAFKRLVETRGGTREVAELAGRTQRHVQERIKLLELAAEDQARMRLAKDDPRHLSVTAARDQLQAHRPTMVGAAPPASVAPEQVDVEEVAPRQIELTPAQALILTEVAHLVAEKPEKKAPDGPTAKLQQGLPMVVLLYVDVAKLLAEGMMRLTNNPTSVTLLPAGDAWLRSQPGNFMDWDYRLRGARQEAGVSDEDLAELERTERYATDWLNGYQGQKRDTLAPADALLVLEILDAKAVQGGPSYYGPKVRGEIPKEQLDDLRRRDVLARQDGPGHDDGIRKVSAAWEATQAVEQHYPKCDQVKRRRDYLAALRLDLDLPAQKDGAYSTDWLNGPFEPDPGWAKAKAGEAAKAERQKAAQEKEQAAQKARSDAFAAFEAELPTLTLDEAGDRVRDWLEIASARAPWRSVEDNYRGVNCISADNTQIDLNGYRDTISRRLAIMAVNIIAGIPPAQWAPGAPQPEPDLDRDAFEAAVAGHLLKDGLDLTTDDAVKCAKQAVDEWLRAEGIEFGDPDFDFTAGGARELATDSDTAEMIAEWLESQEAA